MTRIKIDIDRRRLPSDEKLVWALQILKWSPRWISYYRTNKGWHIEIEMARRVHPWRVIAFQAALGSDYRREIFNLRRTSRWNELPAVARERWNVLFTRKIDIHI